MRHHRLAATFASVIGLCAAAASTQAAIVTTPTGTRAGGGFGSTCSAANDAAGTAV